MMKSWPASLAMRTLSGFLGLSHDLLGIETDVVNSLLYW